MVFTSSQAETWRPLEESCCGEVGRLQRHQRSTRMEEDAQHPQLRIMQRRVLAFLWNAAPLQSGGPAPLAGVNTVCSLAGWVPGEMFHPGPGAHSGHQGQKMWLEGPWGRCCTHSKQVPPGPGGAQGLHRYMQAANKVISSSSCCLSTDGGTPRADYFWLAISDCSCLSQLGWATALCCQPQEQVLLLSRTSSNPRCQHRGALCPAPGKDRLLQHNSRPPSSREHQKPWGSVSWIRGAVIFL